MPLARALAAPRSPFASIQSIKKAFRPLRDGRPVVPPCFEGETPPSFGPCNAGKTAPCTHGAHSAASKARLPAVLRRLLTSGLAAPPPLWVWDLPVTLSVLSRYRTLKVICSISFAILPAKALVVNTFSPYSGAQRLAARKPLAPFAPTPVFLRMSDAKAKFEARFSSAAR